LNPDNNLFFSAASFWEICAKTSLGKLSLKRGWLKKIQEEMRVNAIQWLPVELQHCVELTKLPFHHRDPFDRMLIAQAMTEELQLLSRDSRLSAYEINRNW
jgi:PIN domain nuclease of toxin-antitoxin system